MGRLLVILLAGCGSAGGLDTATIGDGAGALAIAGGGRTITFSRDGRLLLAFGADAFQLGVVDALKENASYDPAWRDPPDLKWQPATGATLTGGGESAQLVLHFDGARATVALTHEAPGRLRAVVTPDGAKVAYLRLRVRAPDREGFYGLGEWEDSVEHRGKLRPMQMEVAPDSESLDNEAHVPVPLLIGASGWGLFVESNRVGLFDVASQDPNLVEVTFADAPLTFHLFAADNGLDVTRRYYDVTGYLYLSPEQARGDATDHRTDLYAIGCILFQMLAGEVPFRGGTFMATLRKQIDERPEAPSLRAPRAKIAPALDAVTLKALAKDREQRFQTVKELALALCAAAGEDARALWGSEAVGDPIPSVDTGPLPLAKRPLAPIAGAVGALALVIAGAWWLARPRPETTTTTATTTTATAAIAAPAIAPPAPPVAAPALTEPVAPAESKIAIVSTPDGADVMQGPERLGATPLTLDYAPDTAPFDVTVGKKGFATRRLTIAPDRDREYVVQLTPAPKPSARKRPAPVAAPAKPPARKLPSELKGLDD